jgi:glucose 1-dehydrogenase
VKLKDKVALVTGAGSGIGRAIAQLFAEEGARVVANDLRAIAAKETIESLGAHATSGRAIPADVADSSQVKAMFAEIERDFGSLDVLVNNAGIVHAAEFVDLAVEDFDRVLRVNLRGAFLCGQAAARQMLAQNPNAAGSRGVIINMSSVNAVLAIANQVPYTVSKGALNQLTKVMSISLAPKGIRVMGIGPGSIATELLRTAVLTNEAARNRILSRTPLGRLGEPEEVARIAVFLASDDASYLTGTTVYPDGGRLGLNYVM